MKFIRTEHPSPRAFSYPSDSVSAICKVFFLDHHEGGGGSANLPRIHSFAKSFAGEDLSIMTTVEYEMATSMQAMRLDERKTNGDLEEFDAFDKGLMDRPIEAKKHFLEHSWTFWFDNPNGKQKQATWGSSLRPVYTFNTVEAFWWYGSSSQRPLSVPVIFFFIVASSVRRIQFRI